MPISYDDLDDAINFAEDSLEKGAARPPARDGDEEPVAEETGKSSSMRQARSRMRQAAWAVSLAETMVSAQLKQQNEKAGLLPNIPFM